MDDRTVDFVVERFNSMLAADRARLEVVARTGSRLTLRYVADGGDVCDACVLDPDDLEMLVAEALERQGSSFTQVSVVR
jgi:hypothetical protein